MSSRTSSFVFVQQFPPKNLPIQSSSTYVPSRWHRSRSFSSLAASVFVVVFAVDVTPPGTDENGVDFWTAARRAAQLPRLFWLALYRIQVPSMRRRTRRIERFAKKPTRAFFRLLRRGRLQNHEIFPPIAGGLISSGFRCAGKSHLLVRVVVSRVRR